VYAASLFALPPAFNVSVEGKSVVAFTKSESAKVSGFTKNELNSSNYLQSGDVKNNGFGQNFLKSCHFEIAFVATKLTDREITLFNSAVSQLSKKILIFPFHTFW
jgi:hypothetical protein